ncbi:glycosyltransferase [Candidatus Nanohalobium constans]|uniref:Glycosyl transferase group 1 n=1 Tax=Candidatus Nanohalobium constans TaxID=2565781 RepID=A0A5Q0UHE7_9ARCH|nr:glycosyltransferase [Candidatus Nanohalobium constans]QGA81057.1 glycosyl transferase group 1 [Candidatus Nanohalobium constans]
MKILYILGNFPKVSETFILNEIYQLEKRGHRIKIIAFNNPEEDIEHDELSNIAAEVHYIDSIRKKSIYKALPTTKKDVKALVSLPKTETMIKEKIKNLYRTKQMSKILDGSDYDPDILMTHFAHNNKYSVEHLSSIYSVPWVIEVHAADIFKKGRKEQGSKLLRYPQKIVTVSEYNRNYLREEFSLEKSIDIVPVSIRPEKFEPKGLKEKNKIVSVGRLVEKKGFKYGIKAFAELKEDYPELEYTIIGEGELENELKQLSEELGVREDINFMGYISDQELKKQIEEAKAFILPCVEAESGDLDAMPMVLKEAMALETPSVSTTVSAIPELIEDGKDGLLAEPKNPEVLSEKLSKLIQSKETREEMGGEARRKIVEDYDIAKNIEVIEESFRKTIT